MQQRFVGSRSPHRCPRGQGRGHAVRLAQEGADVLLVDVCATFGSTGDDGPTVADLEETSVTCVGRGDPALV